MKDILVGQFFEKLWWIKHNARR